MPSSSGFRRSSRMCRRTCFAWGLVASSSIRSKGVSRCASSGPPEVSRCGCATGDTNGRWRETTARRSGRRSIWSRRPEQARALVATLGDLRAKVAAVENLPEAVGQADIVSAATMARQPVLLGEWVRPGTHIDLIGAFTPEMREADDALIASALVYVDFVDTVVDRIGEIMQPILSGAISRGHVRGDLYDLVAADGSSRRSDDQVTLFKNGGGAHLDLMIASYVVEAVEASRICSTDG